MANVVYAHWYDITFKAGVYFWEDPITYLLFVQFLKTAQSAPYIFPPEFVRWLTGYGWYGNVWHPSQNGNPYNGYIIQFDVEFEVRFDGISSEHHPWQFMLISAESTVQQSGCLIIPNILDSKRNLHHGTYFPLVIYSALEKHRC